MFGHRHYVPILKSKAGELDAIKKSPELRTAFTPLVEITPVPVRWVEGKDEPVPAKTIDAHAADLAADVAKAIGSGATIFLDGVHVEEEDVLENDNEPIAEFVEQLRQAGINAIPVVGIDRIVEYTEACKDYCAAQDADACLRLGTLDLENPAQLGDQIGELLDFLGIEPSRIHLVMDFGAIAPGVAGTLRSSLPYQVAALPYLMDWKTLTWAGSAFPSDLAGIGKHATESFARTEWEVWRQICNNAHKLKRLPAFGDYAITHPELFLFDPRKMRIGPKIKYTNNAEWVVGKGESYRRKKDTDQTPSEPPDVQYPKLAKQMMALSGWPGRDFSWGDGFIADCADGKCVGNQQTWVTVGTTHHIACVVRDIANLPAT